MKVLVLGGGAQGSAAAFDLARRPQVTHVVVADLDVSRPPPFLAPLIGERLRLRALDARDPAAVGEAMRGMDVVVCALPYFLNLAMTELAITAGAHYCDLGGNTEVVHRQMALHGRAMERGVSVIPDCGLAPGMANVLAQAGIDALDRVDAVRILVGGLPQHPRPPLNYRIVYSLEGVLDYYTTPAQVLEDGEPAVREALSGVEPVRFAEPLGTLEAFHTAGGMSTMPERHRGRIRSMEYKTLRYPGHADLMRAIRDLGLLSRKPVTVEGCEVVPRDLFIRLASPFLSEGDPRDLVALRVEVKGFSGDVEKTVRYEMVDRWDEATGLTAMMRTTGFSLAIVALMQRDGRVRERGVHTPDEVVPVAPYVSELAARGVAIERTDF